MVRKATPANRAKSAPASKRTSTSQTDNKSDTHRIEWILGACAGLVILAIIGFLGFEAITWTGRRPELSLHVVDQRDTEIGKEMVIEVRNDGQATAASVEVAGTTDGRSWRQVTLDYAPAQSRREVTLILPASPSSEPVQVKIAGYVDP